MGEQDETQTAGTPNPDGGDAAQGQTTGTQESEGRDAGSSGQADDFTRLNLEWKAKAERLNALEAKYGSNFESAIEQRQPQSPAADSQTNADAAYWADVVESARNGDHAAKAAIQIEIQRRQDKRDMMDALALRDIADVTERQEVYNLYTNNRTRYGDVEAAREAVRARRLEAELTKTREEIKRNTAKVDPDVVRTHSRETSAKGTQIRKMSGSEYDRKIAQVPGQGPTREQLQLQRDYSNGLIELED